MRRIALASMAGLLVLASCAEENPTIAGRPGQNRSPAQGPAELPGATCEDVSAGNAENFPDFVDVELESEGGVDRITFRFEPGGNAPPDAPLHFVYFTDQLVTDGEGAPVEVEGEANLVVSFQAIGVDLSGEQPVEVYTGPKRFTPEFGTIREVVELGDFEGQVSWGLGLASKACFVVDAGPDHLTLEFPSA